jgi:hypothetical protein
MALALSGAARYLQRVTLARPKPGQPCKGRPAALAASPFSRIAQQFERRGEGAQAPQGDVR